MSKHSEALDKLRTVDFSQQRYRGYWIRVDPISNTMRIEKDGQLIRRVPAYHSWVYARGVIDQLTE